MVREFKIYNLLKQYEKYYNNKIQINMEDNTSIDFYFDRKKLSHSAGLHYFNINKKNADDVAKKILKDNLTDNDILYKVEKNNRKFFDTVKNRVENIDYFLKNLEKGFLTLVNKSENSNIKSLNFIVETKDNKFLELGLGIDSSEQYYIETFLVRNNDNNIDYTLNKKIKSIEIIKENENIPFSFDEKKNQALLEAYKENRNIDYKKIIEEFEKENFWNNKKDNNKDFER